MDPESLHPESKDPESGNDGPESEPVSDEPPRLVEHFFRHESAHLVAVLTRAFGLRYLDLVEDKVQEAMIAAMESWRTEGIPDNPSGWLYRVARNRVFDALRRDRIHQRAMGFVGETEEHVEARTDDWLAEERLPNSLLRMIFVCCHPALDRKSQIALTLKILCGFSLAEIARGLLISAEAAKKRVQRAKKTLAELQLQVELPDGSELATRLSAVHDVLYVLFNEGYSASSGHLPIRDDICEEAARLCHLLCSHQLCEHETLSTPETRALLALMLSHSARLAARVDSEGAVVLLAEQDRSRWDQRLIRHAELWLARSKTATPSRFHLEAALSMAHCRAATFAETDWQLIVRLYDRLLKLLDSPVYRLNRAIARGEVGDVERALREIDSIRGHRDLRGYVWLHCAEGRLHELADNCRAAAEAYSDALRADVAPHERAEIERKLATLRRRISGPDSAY